MMVPAFSGLGTPYWDSRIRGIITGLNLGTQKAHIARATLEAIVHQVADVIDVFRKEVHGMRMRQARVDGGVAKGDYVLSSQANFSRIGIARSSQSESTALGAAMLAGLAVEIVRLMPVLHRGSL